MIRRQSSSVERESVLEKMQSSVLLHFLMLIKELFSFCITEGVRKALGKPMTDGLISVKSLLTIDVHLYCFEKNS